MRGFLKIFSSFLLLTVVTQSCKQPSSKLTTGMWRAEIATSVGPLPFNLLVNSEQEVFIINGIEKLAVDTLYYQGDSLIFDMEVFEGRIAAVVADGELSGTFSKKMNDMSTRSTSFKAAHGSIERFEGAKESTPHDINGKWEVIFNEPEGTSYPALGVFDQESSKVTGTFLTETGDYRFLAGNVVGDSLKLSCFDGTHVFLFTAKIEGDQLVGGQFSASLTYEETWEGLKNEDAVLSDPTKLTYLKEGYDGINFSFPNTKGEMVSLSDEKYKGKVVILQILGTWCPNCMDETKFLTKWYAENKDRGVEIIGLAFEKSSDPTYAFPKIDKMTNRFGVNYEVLLAGPLDKEEAQKSLPMLNKIISYPTAIFIDKQGEVRKIHTGFSGPGTGEYYGEFLKDFEETMDGLLAE